VFCSCLLHYTYNSLKLSAILIDAHGKAVPMDDNAARTLPAGYAYIAFSSDASDHKCEKSIISLGVPVNTCVAVGDYGYKVQIVEGEH
jgi:hypothetical protein